MRCWGQVDCVNMAKCFCDTASSKSHESSKSLKPLKSLELSKLLPFYCTWFINDLFLTVIWFCNMAPKSLKIMLEQTFILFSPTAGPIGSTCARPPFADIVQTMQALLGAWPHFRGSSTSTIPLLLHLLSFVVGALLTFLFPLCFAYHFSWCIHWCT